MNIKEIVRISEGKAKLLTACQMAYRKHHLDDDSIGWDELSDMLFNVLCEVMGDEEFQEWRKEVNHGKATGPWAYPDR